MTTAGSPRAAQPSAPGHDLPDFVRGLLDDAAVFPPGLAPLPDAVAAHRGYRESWFAGVVGPLVVGAPALEELACVLIDGGGTAVGGPEPLALAVTLPGGPSVLAAVLAVVASLPVKLRSLEIAVPAGMQPKELLDALASVGTGVEVYVEVPWDQRRDRLLAALACTRYMAKFRTGGVRADLYPDEAELAAAVRTAVDGGVPFKATAGLHHALRNTDPETGFEQHGFLNLLLAAGAAACGADEPEVRAVLGERDATVVAGRVRELAEHGAAARAWFRSFGTCSITDPLTELVDLGLVGRPGGEP